MSKDRWFDEFVATLNELEDSGVSQNRAYNVAGDIADKRYRELVAAEIDQRLMEKKESKYHEGHR